jgi:hypothetical protein
MTTAKILLSLQELGHSLFQLERELGLSAGYLSKVKQGHVTPSFQLVSLLTLVEQNPKRTLETIRALPGRKQHAVASKKKTASQE